MLDTGEVPTSIISSNPHSSSVRVFQAAYPQAGYSASQSLRFLICNNEMKTYFIGFLSELSEIMQLMVFGTQLGLQKWQKLRCKGQEDLGVWKGSEECKG